MTLKRALLLSAAFIALSATSSLACTNTISADTTLTGSISCQQELTFGTLTVAGELANGGEPATIRALTNSSDSGIVILASGAVKETGTGFSYNSAIAVGDGTNTYLLGKVENFGSIENSHYEANERTFIVHTNATLDALINHEDASIKVYATGGGGATIRVRGSLGTLRNDGLIEDRASTLSL